MEDYIPHSTPGAVTTVTETRNGEGTGAGGYRGNHHGGADAHRNGNGRRHAPGPVAGKDFTISKRVVAGARFRLYERQPEDPLYRPLRIYALDPAVSTQEGAVATVDVPYEPLEPGPVGDFFKVKPRGDLTEVIDLEDPTLLLTSGRSPSPTDPRFHMQMVYAVCSVVYATFRAALGRHVAWAFEPPAGSDRRGQLTLVPHVADLSGASYQRGSGELLFGIETTADDVIGRIIPGKDVFACVSHDVITHEVTHALLDGLRAHFLERTSAEIQGFHEGFADVIALLLHFSYREVVREALGRSRGNVTHAALLTSLALQFGQAKGRTNGNRSAVTLKHGELVPRPLDPTEGSHGIGETFLSAVFDAFVTVFRRKTQRYLRLATGGTGALPPGEISADLQEVLAEEASQLASQFLNVCIRAIDYCPPVDMRLGEFLRAVITADLDLVPDDRWGYREAWIDAFARHRIFPPKVQSLGEDELRWEFRGTREKGMRRLRRVRELSFRRLRFAGDPGRPAGRGELCRQAVALGRLAVRNPDDFGLVAPGEFPVELENPVTATADLPQVQSIRASRRAGPDGQVVFDLVGEVSQRAVVHFPGFDMEFLGGATVILDPRGDVRYVIAKQVNDPVRIQRQRDFKKPE
ncbi:MAG TPA: hypothetical protein VFT45_19470 [Longimicrobium sp.]|nr:hypothetical protein [Longimicrobium sp.]